MIRVLQVLDNITAGGIQSFVMNVYRKIDREVIQFDFLIHHVYDQSFEEEIINMGGKIFVLPPRNQGIIKNKRALNNFFKKYASKYKAIHFHESSLSYIEPLKYAKKYSIPIRIVHSHSTRGPKSKIHKIMHIINKHFIGKYANEFLACGDLAAKWMYGGSPIEKKVNIIYNGINLSKFQFNESIRNKVRKELGVEKKLVLGHVGRFEPVKNHKFLLNIMKCISNYNSEVVLLLVGNGRTLEEIKEHSEKLKIRDKIYFLGQRNDVNRLYQAMDIMILPSLYEGFPVTIIEAEASGVPCILSDSITQEAALKSNVFYIGLDKSADYWAKEILKQHFRIIDNSILSEQGFSIETTVEKIIKLYSGIK